MAGRGVRPPRLAAALLQVTLPSDGVRDSILGDMWQEHANRARSGSRIRAALWYWRHALGVGGRALLRRVRPPRDDEGRRRGRLTGMLDNLRQDVGFALRQIAARPASTAVIVGTLAIAIGPNVAIFSIFKAVILEPLPYPAPARLVHLWETDVSGRWRGGLTAPDYWQYRERSASFEEIGVYNPYTFNLGDSEPVRVSGVLCSASLLRALGVEPALGRLFTDAEERAGDGVVIISHELWQQRYRGGSDIVGRSIMINGTPRQVVGVMSADFEFLSAWSRDQSPQLWTPYPLRGHPGTLTRDFDHSGGHWLLSVGRLRAGVDTSRAEQEMRGIAAGLAQEYPDSNARNQVWLQPFVIEVFGSAAGRLLLLGGTVGLVLLVACANVAAMLLAKGAGRQTELAIRVALGSARWRLVRQLLTESVLIAVIAGVVGVGLAAWSLLAMRNLLPPDLPRAHSIGIDPAVLLFTLLLSVGTALLFGLAPAWRAARADVVNALKGTTSGTASGRRRNRTLRRLAIAQLAVALLMTNGAVFLYKSLRNVLELPQSFDTERVVTAEILLAGGAYEDEAARVAFWQQLIERVEALPDVERAAVSAQLPLETGTFDYYLRDGEPFDAEQAQRTVWRNFVSPGYFEAMGIPLLVGRDLLPSDRAEPSITAWRPDQQTPRWNVVINRALADVAWPGENPIGKRLHSIEMPPRWSAVVVGVVEGVRQGGPERRSDPAIYWLYQANPFAGAYLVVRARGNPLALIESVRARIADVDENIPLSKIRTMGTVLDTAMRGRYFITVLTGLFTLIAVVLAVVGTYGIMSYYVEQRTHELGVRRALGANRWRLVGMVFRQALRMLLFGVTLGVVLVINVGFLARRLVYGISPFDPMTIATVVAFIVVIALAAALRPALRATRVDPLLALRAE